MDVSADTLRVLLFLAPGFLGFRLYQIDADWQKIRNIDIIYGSLVFSAFGYSPYIIISEEYSINNKTWLIFSSFAISIVAALVWRRFGHVLLHRLLNYLGLTNEDNLGDVWQKIFNDPRIYVTQIAAYMNNGQAIQCDDTASFDRPDLRAKGIFPYYAHRDGQICFVPNLRQLSPGSEWEELDDIVSSPEWGVRMVYLNPDEVQRLELRITPVNYHL